MKVALVYDRVNKFGGAERVLLALHEIFPDAPLYTSVYNVDTASWAKVFDIRTSFLQNLPLPKDKHEYYPFLMGMAFESFNFDDYDLVISITHEFAKAIITKPHTKHLCYCLTPTSYLWSGYDQYFSNRPILKFLTKPLIKYLRWYDRIIASRPDKYIAISKTVQERIKKYYDLASDLIYPPVEIHNTKYVIHNTGSYFLIVSRLVPNKRIDIAVDAFNQTGLPLKIIGTGKELNNLKSKANKNIEFLGYLSDDQVRDYYQNCQAVIICGEEDFNIVAVEAQSFGKPVLAFRAGGVTETVIDGVTGYFFDRQTAKSLVQLLNTLKLENIKPVDCIKNARKFSKGNFQKVFLNYVERLF